MKISNFSLAIGIPCSYPYVPIQFFSSFISLERPDFTYIHADSGPIDTLRNDIVEKALAINATHLIMLDTDMIYHPQTISRLLSHKLPIVGALCWRRYPPFDSIMLRIRKGAYESVEDFKNGELVEVDATGAACLMVETRVYRDLPKPWFKFHKHPATNAIIGEDIGFCQDVKAKGYKIYVDTSVHADHLTTLQVNKNTGRLYQAMKQQKHKNALNEALKTINNKE